MHCLCHSKVQNVAFLDTGQSITVFDTAAQQSLTQLIAATCTFAALELSEHKKTNVILNAGITTWFKRKMYM